ncbi:hypothetical protein L6452_26832 [Arctium lappa]|uniref:Uncharacterized protein n=1 Tax=Arctium lappa TaxID=4217 RepID=A0ACB8ZZP6_ARCLA|nr:hypothetical protein L6452_26832 [Arctium lappa]
MRTFKLLTFIRGAVPAHSFYSINLDSGRSAIRMDTPFDSLGFFHQVLGSCNALICLSRGRSNREILLWNPSTKKFRVVQTMPMHYPPGSEGTFAIDRVGYDHVNDEYKVVRLSQSTGSDSNLVDSKVTIYSLKLNVWQTVEQDFRYHVCQQRGQGVFCSGPMSHGVSVCGAVHWVVTQKPPPNINYLIAAFDLHRHSFQLVPQPEYSDKYVAVDLGILGGCLCVVGNHEQGVDVWVMAKYGVKESWIKLIVMPFSHHMMNVCSCVKPLGYLKNGKQVLLEVDNQWFMRYNLEKKTWKLTKIRNVSHIPTLVYHESLA